MGLLISSQKSHLHIRHEDYDKCLASIKAFLNEHFNPDLEIYDAKIILEASTFQEAMDAAMFKCTYDAQGDLRGFEYLADKRPPAHDAPFNFLKSFFRYARPRSTFIMVEGYTSYLLKVYNRKAELSKYTREVYRMIQKFSHSNSRPEIPAEWDDKLRFIPWGEQISFTLHHEFTERHDVNFQIKATCDDANVLIHIDKDHVNQSGQAKITITLPQHSGNYKLVELPPVKYHEFVVKISATNLSDGIENSYDQHIKAFELI